MSKSVSLVLFALMVAGTTAAQPAVIPSGIRNAASARYGLPNPGVAPGAWFIVQGSGLGPATPALGDTPQTELGGTSAKVSAGGSTFDVLLIAATSAELLALLPADVPPGDATLAITAQGNTGEPAPFKVVPSSFGLFTTSQAADLQRVYASVRSGAFFYLYDLPAPAKPGDELALFGTGLGSAETVEVLIGDKSAEVLSKGSEDCCPGLDRITIRVPADVEGCGQPITVKTGDIANLVGVISIASDGRFCPDRGGFSASDLEKAERNGHLKAGYLFLMRFLQPGSPQSIDMGFANYSKVSYDLLRQYRSDWAQRVPGACYAANTDQQLQLAGQPGAAFFDDFYPFGETPLAAGPTVNLGGPGGSQQMPQIAPGLYNGIFFNMSNPLISFFSPGDYTVETTGGEVGNSSGTVKVGAPIQFTNLDTMASISRAQDYKITWTGGSPSDRVWIAAYSASITGTTVKAGIVQCFELASKGSVTLPASMLSLLPENSQMGASMLLLYSLAAPQRYEPSGGNLDAGYLLSLSYAAAPVTFR